MKRKNNGIGSTDICTVKSYFVLNVSWHSGSQVMTLTHHGHVMGLVCEYLTPVSQYRLSKNIWSGKHCRGVARGGAEGARAPGIW